MAFSVLVMPNLLSSWSFTASVPLADRTLFFTQYCKMPAALVMLLELSALSPPFSKPVREDSEVPLVLPPDLLSSPAALLRESIRPAA
ncbi:hypothetical protein D3C71_1846710 [compost metagenome]